MTRDFFEKYEIEYNSKPVIPFHSTGTYDAIKMFIKAIEEVGYNGEKIREYLMRNIRNWEGMNGVVSFDEKGNTETGFILKQLIGGEKVRVK